MMVKLYKFYAAIAVCLIVSVGHLSAQKISLDYNNVPLRTILKSIENQTDYSFVYSSSSIAIDSNASISITDSELPAILDILLKDKGVAYHFSDNQIILSPAPYQQTQPQDREIKGVVRGEDEETLIGATIVSDNGKNHAITDATGQFSITGKFTPDSRLAISYIGYETAYVDVGTRNYFEIMLEPSVFAISEVVVTGYQSLSRERATGSFDKISPEILSHPTSNIGNSFIGTVSGIQTTSDEKGNLRMEIRGRTTLSANEHPLLVVDGFEIEGDMGSLNPNDIESIHILKDAAAASIWGARAANGVIVVVTRGGKFARRDQPATIEFSSFMRFSPKADIHYYRPMASSKETVEYEKIAANNWSSMLTPDGFGSPVFMIGLTPTMTAINEYKHGYITKDQMNAILEQYSGYDNSKQIKKYLFQNLFTQQYNLNISGATERMSNNLSLLYESNAFHKKGEERWKTQVSYCSNIAVAKWLDFKFSGTYSYMKDTDNSISSSKGGGYDYDIQSLARYQMLLDENGKMINIPISWYQPNMDRYVDQTLFPYDFWGNPINELSARDLYTVYNTARAQAGLTFKITQGLNFTVSGQYELTTALSKKYYSEKSINVRKTINESSTYDRETGTLERNLPLGGFLDQNRMQIDRWDVRAQIDFSRTFNLHDISVIAGMETRERIAQLSDSPRAYGYNPEKMSSSPFPNGPGSGSDNDKMLSDWNGLPIFFDYTNNFGYRTDRFVSAYTNASYSYDGKYTATASVRNDASNLISDDPSYRYAPFWSAGLLWRIGHEKFMSDVTWADRLMLRLTYGYNGNIDTSTSFMPLISMSGGTNLYTNEQTASISSYGNPSLRWERTGTWNLGLDFSLLNSRLFGKIEGYNKKSTDMIARVSIPSINGTILQKLNNAEMINRGFEVEIGTRHKIYGSNITWTGTLNAAYNHNEITKLFVSSYYPEGLVYGGNMAENYSVDALWSYRYNGMINAGSDTSPDWQPTIRGAYNADTKQYDYNTFRSWPSGDAFEISKYEGVTTAPWNLGFVNNFKIFDFDLSIIAYAKLGHKFRRTGFNYPEAFLSNVYPNKYLSEVMNGDPDKIIPLPYNDDEDMMYFWDRYHPYMDYLVENAGHIRLREITVTYNVPARKLSKIKIDKLQLHAQANNVRNFYFNKYNEDPEFRLGSVKQMVSFTFGMKAVF